MRDDVEQGPFDAGGRPASSQALQGGCGVDAVSPNWGALADLLLPDGNPLDDLRLLAESADPRAPGVECC